MSMRERLWQRTSGTGLWPLAWAMALAAALPWVLPERWNGALGGGWIALGGLLVLGSWPLFRWRRWAVVPLSLTLVGFVFGALRQRARWESALPAGFQAVEGRIDAPWSLRGERRQGSLRVFAPASLRGLSLPLSLPAEGEAAPPPGTPVRFRAELRTVDPAPLFIAERPLWRARSDGAPRRVYLASAQLLEVLGPPRPSPLLRLQAFVRRRFEALPLPDGPARDLWGALTLAIPPAHDEAFSAFAESGTIHTLVVSGLQVTLVMVALEALWRRLLRRGGFWASAAGGLLYAALVGFSAPVWRGLLMGFAWAAGRGSGWKLPPVLTLHGALLLWLLTHPAAGCEPGFLLAWFALVGLLWGAEPLAGILAPLLGRWALPFSRFLAPWAATLPLLALLYGGAPVWGVPANLLLLPLVVLLTPLCLFLTLLPVPGLVQGAGWLLAWTGGHLVPVFARVVPLGTDPLWPWILLALGWILLAQRQAKLQRTRALTWTLLAASGALLISGGFGRAPRTLSLEAVDIGQGDALLLRVPGGDATLIDTGLTPYSARRLARVLSRRGVREPLHLVVTHPHGDHAGGWSTLARLRPLASTSLATTAGGPEDWEPYVPRALAARATPLVRGDAWNRGGAAFSVRWPPVPLAISDPNMVSAVLRVRWRDRELWLMGDALQIQERDLLDLGEPGGGPFHRLLKVGHHGSRSASNPAWVAALRPEVAVIPAGRHNRFEHPHPEALAALASAGVPAPWITGSCAGVRVEAVAGGWNLETGDGGTAFVPLR